MSHSLTKDISGLEGSSDGVLLLLQEVVLVLCLLSQIVRVWTYALFMKGRGCVLTSLPVVLESGFSYSFLLTKSFWSLVKL